MRYAIEIARLVRETQTVLVEADSPEDAEKILSAVYKAAQGADFDDRWEADAMWGCDEGTRDMIGPASTDTIGAPEVKLGEAKKEK